MIRHWLRGLNVTTQASRRGSRDRRGRRQWGLEGLEDRVLLSGTPTAYTVNLLSYADDGSGNSGDLLYVVLAANQDTNPAGSVISFDPTVFAQQVPITLNFTVELTNKKFPEVIDGPATNTVVIDGNASVKSGDFMVDSGVNATLSHLTIINGFNTQDGGGIANYGTLTVANCDIGGLGGNTAHNDGGGIGNHGDLTVTDSFIQNNNAISNGSGVSNFGTLTITDSLIKNNTSSNDGGGIESLSGKLTVTDSLITANTAGSDGGGIHNFDASRLVISSSTIEGNSALNGGGIENEGTMTAVNDTIAYNEAGAGGAGVPGFGGGLYNAGGTATLDNTIVALNVNDSTSPGTADDIPLPVSSSGAFNLIGTGGSGGLTNGSNGNQVGVADAGLGTLDSHGGPLSTIALLPGSPAINKGSNALAVDPATGQPLTTDQRGAGFDRILNGTVDIGAYEFLPAKVVGVSVAWGSAGTSALQTAADGLRLLPAGRNTDMPWLGIARIQVTLNQPATLTAADVTIRGAGGTNYGPVTISGSGTSYTITLAQPIAAADRVTLAIGGPSFFSFTRRLDVLPGDFNDDGAVNRKDSAAVTKAFRHARRVTPSIFGDVLGDGTVDARDNKAELKLASKKPSKAGGKAAKVILARDLARQHGHETPGQAARVILEPKHLRP